MPIYDIGDQYGDSHETDPMETAQNTITGAVNAITQARIFPPLSIGAMYGIPRRYQEVQLNPMPTPLESLCAKFRRLN